eukprot:scaffold12567_cov143-Isochrysis_galbana.AAC.3
MGPCFRREGEIVVAHQHRLASQIVPFRQHVRVVVHIGTTCPALQTVLRTASWVAPVDIIIVAAVGEERIDAESVCSDLVTQDICELECDESSGRPGHQTVGLPDAADEARPNTIHPVLAHSIPAHPAHCRRYAVKHSRRDQIDGVVHVLVEMSHKDVGAISGVRSIPLQIGRRVDPHDRWCEAHVFPQVLEVRGIVEVALSVDTRNELPERLLHPGAAAMRVRGERRTRKPTDGWVSGWFPQCRSEHGQIRGKVFREHSRRFYS